MSKPHSKLVQDSIKYLNSLPQCKAFSYTPGPYGKRSVSDILFCYHGRFGAVEIKIGDDTCTPLQSIFLRDIQKAGGYAGVCRSIEEVKQFIQTH